MKQITESKCCLVLGLPEGWEKIESPNFGVYYVKYVKYHHQWIFTHFPCEKTSFLPCNYTNFGHPDKILRQILKIGNQKLSSK